MTQKAFIIRLCAVMLLGLVAAGVVYAFESQRPYVLTSEIEAKIQEKNASSTSGAMRIPILVYHSIQPHQAGESLMKKRFDISPETLEEQLRYLKEHGYTTITLEALAEDIRSGTTSPVAKPVVLTFDDGWQDHYTKAFPLLEKYHDTATFYVYTNPIGKDPRFLTWSEIQEMSAAGMTIGSHTLSHPLLSTLTPAQLQSEVVNSKKILETHLGKPVVDFASPFGYSTKTLEQLLAQAGYTTGRTGYKGNYHSKNDLLRLSSYYTPNSTSDFVWVMRYAP
ncbi:MAG: polysaccharide deacetylase family protein [Candidatus Adlerbacteria bacterium]|nr:polysaccharide deacetylase family protein [Candidatus Adlerbacteria bacterium]